MNVLWVCNLPIPKISIAMRQEPQNIGGWLTGFANSLITKKEVSLYICFPLLGEKNLVTGMVDNQIKYYGFPIPRRWGILPVEDETRVAPSLEKDLIKIIYDARPDILHIFGTEFPHSLIAAKVFNRPNRTVVNIQGLISIYAKHYYSSLPTPVLRKFAISNLVRGNMIEQKKRLEKRGLFEIETLKRVNHVIGRTDWDRACTSQINPNAQYHFCNESLRDEFYNRHWRLDTCDRYSIFMSQSSLPFKGLHYMLEAMPEIIKRFPNAHLYVAGNNPTDTCGVYNRLKMSSYGIYLSELIRRYGLANHITFLGNLSEVEMCERFLHSNVFVLASAIENSPNSLGEAMLLGVPVVCSDVGGVKNLMNHNEDGFLYQHDAPYMLANYLCEIFASDDLAIRFSCNAQEHARATHDRAINAKTLINIYERIYQRCR